MAKTPDSSTLTATAEPEAQGDTAYHPHLFLVLQADSPLAPPARIALAKVSEVVLGRGSPRTIETEEDEAGRRVVVRLDDRRISSTHACVTKVLRKWAIEDAGSKNGTIVNGVKKSHAELTD